MILRSTLILATLVSGSLVSLPAIASETITYTYDARGRLTAVTHSGDTNDGVQAHYTYDKADNRTNVTVEGGSSGPPESGTSPSGYQVRYVYNGRFFISLINTD